MAAGLHWRTETYPLMFQPYGGFADGVPVRMDTSPYPRPGLGIRGRPSSTGVKALSD